MMWRTSGPMNDFISVFFFNDTATTEIYTLSLHDALPISTALYAGISISLAAKVFGSDAILYGSGGNWSELFRRPREFNAVDRKSTRLNSSHANISYAVFSLIQKNTRNANPSTSPPTSTAP